MAKEPKNYPYKKFPPGSKKRGVLFNVLSSELKAVYPPMAKVNKAKAKPNNNK